MDYDLNNSDYFRYEHDDQWQRGKGQRETQEKREVGERIDFRP